MESKEMTPADAERIANSLILDLLQRLSSLTVELLAAAKNDSTKEFVGKGLSRLYLGGAYDKAIMCRNHADNAAREIARIAGLFGWDFMTNDVSTKEGNMEMLEVSQKIMDLFRQAGLAKDDCLAGMEIGNFSAKWDRGIRDQIDSGLKELQEMGLLRYAEKREEYFLTEAGYNFLYR